MASEDVLMTIHPSPLRRVLAVVLLAALGVVLIYVASGPQIDTVVWKLLTGAVGVAAFVMAKQVWQATAQAIELSDSGLRQSDGRMLCAIEHIASVDRGAFAFKPNNGLLIRLKEPDENAWAPGLWWRYGRRIGIGGVTNAGEAKAMAETIILKLEDMKAVAAD